ncbi:MAG: response regulator transcription factor [Thermoleophilia bacterium]
MCAHLLIVEDDETIAEYLVDNLRQDGHAVTPVTTATEAVAALKRGVPEIALVDVSLPDGSGLDIVRMIRGGEAGSPDVGVIMVSGRSSEQDRVRAFERGVDDYVVKPFSYPELLLRTAALESRLRGRVGSVLHVGPLTIDLPARSATVNGALLHLPSKEYELLAVLARDPHKVYMKEDLMERIWGYRNAGTRTLDSHASRLRRRLMAVADGPWVINNWSVGYSLRTVLR